MQAYPGVHSAAYPMDKGPSELTSHQSRLHGGQECSEIYLFWHCVFSCGATGYRSPHDMPGQAQFHPNGNPAPEWGGWSARRSSRFTPKKDPVPIVQEAGGPRGRSKRQGKSSPTGIRFPDLTVHSTLSRLPLLLWYPDLKTSFIFSVYHSVGIRAGAVGWSTALQARR